MLESGQSETAQRTVCQLAVSSDGGQREKGNELVFRETCQLEYADVTSLKRKNADFQL